MENHFQDSFKEQSNKPENGFKTGVEITAIKQFNTETEKMDVSISFLMNESSSQIELPDSELNGLFEKHEKTLIKIYDAYQKGDLDFNLLDQLLDIDN